jgi:hypothetical protein
MYRLALGVVTVAVLRELRVSQNLGRHNRHADLRCQRCGTDAERGRARPKLQRWAA